MRFPASRGSFHIRYSLFDVIWAAVSPPIALYLRAVDISNLSHLQAAELFCLVSFSSSVIAFLIFRIRDVVAHHFSVHDALEVGKAVLVSEFLTILALFTAVRLEGIPRSTPVIHALILTAGLVIYRVIVRLRHGDPRQRTELSETATEHVVMIGCTRLSSLYMRLMKAYSAQRYKIVAIVDDDPRNIGKSVDGVRVVGPPEQLEPIVQEFAEHGIAVSRVLVGGDHDLLVPEAIDAVERACAALNVRLDYIPSLIGFDRPVEPVEMETGVIQPTPNAEIQLPSYFKFKGISDIVIGLIALILLSPILLAAACVVLIDVGSPILFWQQRIGLGGRPFLLHKFRTLKPLFNARGVPIGTSDRASWAGAFIRKMRFDELPQLLNVAVGDMSVVGPRPLLPRDQPANPTIRLMVRPGLTGWAQVNGGKSLTAEQKNEYDEWYVRNASLLLDLRILWLTLEFLFKGDHPAAKSTLDCQEAADNR